MTEQAVTIIGLGPMGQALAGAFLDAGYRTTVWNRTPAKADALVARGAHRADTPAGAVHASPLVITCVLDYDAVHAILGPATGALRGRTLVNLTADTPERARETAAWAAGHGIDYLDGAIMTPTVTIGTPDAVLLYSGPETVHTRHQPVLSRLGGTQTYLGADPGRAAAYDVALLDLFWTAMSGYVHATALARAENITASELAPFARGIGELLPPIITEFAGMIDEGRHAGTSTIVSATASMDHIARLARDRGIDSGVLDAARAVARRAIDAGHGEDEFSRLVEVLSAGDRAAAG